MVKKTIDFKILGPVLLFLLLILAAIFYNVSKNKEILKHNEELVSTVENLNSKLLIMSEQLEANIAKASKQASELDKLRNKLTEERLQNVKLQQELEEIKSEVLIESPEAPPVQAKEESSP